MPPGLPGLQQLDLRELMSDLDSSLAQLEKATPMPYGRAPRLDDLQRKLNMADPGLMFSGHLPLPAPLKSATSPRG